MKAKILGEDKRWVKRGSKVVWAFLLFFPRFWNLRFYVGGF
jgi:hypothetical protein